MASKFTSASISAADSARGGGTSKGSSNRPQKRSIKSSSRKYYIIAVLLLLVSMSATIFAPTARNLLFSASRLLNSKASHHPTTAAILRNIQPSNSAYINNKPILSSNMSTKSTSLAEAITLRRSIYGLTSELTVPQARVIELAEHAVKEVPSAFNSQTTRLVIVFGEENKRFWNGVVAATLKSKLDAEHFEKMKGRLDAFAAAAGTILFFEHTATIKQMQERTPAYAALFPEWSEHTSGMHQYALWVGLEAEGMGANLQHFNFDADVEKKTTETFKLPGDDLRLRAQLVFGKPADGAWPTTGKDKLPTSETVKVFGKM